MDPEDFQNTAQIALDYEIIKKPASDDAYRTDLAEAAVEELKEDDLDVTGDGWQKETVTLTEGGK
jgi:hypothetical protein